MAAIGAGWVDGAWVKESWADNAWAPGVSIAVSGTAAAGLTEAQVVAGGDTIIFTLTGDTFITEPLWSALVGLGALPVDSDKAEATGWDAVVKTPLRATWVRTSDTVATATIPASATYDITADETLTGGVSYLLLAHTDLAITHGGLPTFDVVTDVAEVDTKGGGKSRRQRKYPRWVQVDGKRYRVFSADEERQLLRALLDRAEAAAKTAEALGDEPLAETINKRAIRIEKRIDAVASREDEWLARLREEDDEILLMLH